jgi:LysR family pca operon transcriptional activator
MAIDPRRLLELRQIAQFGSFGRAAAALGMSQPGLSKNVSVLERSIGARVVERSRKGSRLTEIGELLLRHADGLDALLARASTEVNERKKGLSGSLAIGVSPVATASLVPRAIAALLAESPDIATTIYERPDDELIRQLRAGELDLVVNPAGLWRNTSDIHAETITRDRFAVVVRRGHPLSRKKAVSLRDLRTAQWVVPDLHTAMYRQIEALFAAQGEPWPQKLVVTNSITTLRSLIMWSDFVTISSTVLTRPDVEAGFLVALALRGTNPSREITVRTRTHPQPNALVKRFVAHLRTAAAS